MSIIFTRYHLPNGRQTKEQIERAPEVEAEAKAFIDNGGRFDIEQLRTGDFSLTAEHPMFDELLAIELCQGDKIGEAVDKLVATVATLKNIMFGHVDGRGATENHGPDCGCGATPDDEGPDGEELFEAGLQRIADEEGEHGR